MDSLMAGEAEARGAMTSGFRSRGLTLRMVDEADVVLTAETRHRLFILEERPLAMRKTFSLGQFRRGLSALDGDHQDLLNRIQAKAATSTAADDVADPHGRGAPAAATAALELDQLLGQIVPALARAWR
jgi:protein-tyrosine-phosphatase